MSGKPNQSLLTTATQNSLSSPTTQTRLSTTDTSREIGPVGDSPSQTHSKSPTNAIIGGVIGGVGLVAILLLVYFYLRRKRRAAERSTNSVGSPAIRPYTEEKLGDIPQLGPSPPAAHVNNILPGQASKAPLHPSTLSYRPIISHAPSNSLDSSGRPSESVEIPIRSSASHPPRDPVPSPDFTRPLPSPPFVNHNSNSGPNHLSNHISAPATFPTSPSAPTDLVPVLQNQIEDLRAQVQWLTANVAGTGGNATNLTSPTDRVAPLEPPPQYEPRRASDQSPST